MHLNLHLASADHVEELPSILYQVFPLCNVASNQRPEELHVLWPELEDIYGGDSAGL